MSKVELAKARLEAAKLKVQAAELMAHALSSERQAQKPAYDGQEQICLNNASKYRAMAEAMYAKAEIIIAEAEKKFAADNANKEGGQ